MNINIDKIDNKGSFRVNRGGSYHYGAVYCEVGFMGNRYPDLSRLHLGFRITKTKEVKNECK
jgi:formylglycine-generating enzyme required for sulfatase activity